MHPSNQVSVSIVFPLIAETGIVHKAIQSIVDQDYRDFELIVPFAKTAISPHFLNHPVFQDARIRLIPCNQSEVSGLKNTGIDQSQGTFITVSHQHAIYYLNKLSVMVPLAMKYGMAIDNASVTLPFSGFIFKAKNLREDRLIDVGDTSLMPINVFPVIKKTRCPRFEIGHEYLSNIVFVEKALEMNEGNAWMIQKPLQFSYIDPYTIDMDQIEDISHVEKECREILENTCPEFIRIDIENKARLMRNAVLSRRNSFFRFLVNEFPNQVRNLNACDF